MKRKTSDLSLSGKVCTGRRDSKRVISSLEKADREGLVRGDDIVALPPL